MPNSLCIIPARGGSKRIPKKNVKEFHGKPIIAYSIQAALESKLFSEVMVSTDCKDIKSFSVNYGAKVPFLRSEKNADDFATTVDVVNEVLKTYESEGVVFDKICVLYPCAPLVKVEDLVGANEMLNDFECVIPVVKFDFPPLRSFKMSGSTLSYMWPEFEKFRSQDLPELFHDAGQWYFFKHFGKTHDSIVKESTASLVIESSRVQDIDTLVDWKLAEMKFKLMK